MIGKIANGTIILLMLSCIASGEEYPTRKGVYICKKSSELRSNFSFYIQQSSRDGKSFYRYTEHGEGDYDKYLDITWDIDAEAEEKEDILYLLYSTRTIRDKDENIIIKYEKHFDYAEGKIHYVSSDGKGDIIKERNFPIKGNTTDDITLSYFLKTYVAHRDDKTYRSFYLLSSEPSLYRITIKVVGSETLDLPTGKIEAIKLRLIPNLGLLTGLTTAFIPPTYVWYTERPPYIWLQYEGLEAGLGTSYIMAYISE